MKLTKKQAEMLSHRLEISYALSEVYQDQFGTIERPEEFDRELEALEQAVSSGRLDKPLTDLQKWMLQEAVEGSTWVGTADPPGPARRVVIKTAEKIEKYLGLEPGAVDIDCALIGNF